MFKVTILTQSLIHYGKVYTAEHNIKVMPLGMVARNSLGSLLSQFQDVWMNGVGTQFEQASRVATTRTASQSDHASNAENAIKALQDGGFSLKEAIHEIRDRLVSANQSALAAGESNTGDLRSGITTALQQQAATMIQRHGQIRIPIEEELARYSRGCRDKQGSKDSCGS